MYAFHRARFPTLLGIAWFRAGAMGTHVAGFFSLVVAFGFHTETPRPGERVLRLYTSENSQSDPHCLAPWKMVFLYQPVVFRVHVSLPGCMDDSVNCNQPHHFWLLRLKTMNQTLGLQGNRNPQRFRKGPRSSIVFKINLRNMSKSSHPKMGG